MNPYQCIKKIKQILKKILGFFFIIIDYNIRMKKRIGL